MRRTSLDFIDWMKAIGISLIVVGHVAGSLINRLTPPIYPKQLGVAFFLFAMGFLLAGEDRPRWEVVRDRLFEVYLFGLAFAVMTTAIGYLQDGSLYASNYLPFFAGANVAIDNFPANPTTWYIGTYLHFLLLWALALRGVAVRRWMIAAALAGEIAARALLMATAGGFIAYMAMPNWMTVFVLGMWYGQRLAERRRALSEVAGRQGWLASWFLFATLTISWATFAPWAISERSIPFMRMGLGSERFTIVLTSACVSFLYLSYTWLMFQLTLRLRAPAMIRFIARNTVIVFIAHMPLYYLLDSRLPLWTTNRPIQIFVRVSACLALLAIVSEFVRRIVRPAHLRARLFGAGRAYETAA